MPRVVADVDLLHGYAEHVVNVDGGRRQQGRDLEAALDRFLSSGSMFVPPAISVPSELGRLFRDTLVDGHSVMATAAAFRQAEVRMGADRLASWHPDDAWIERQRRAWLMEFHPEAVGSAAPVLDPSAVIARVREIDAALRIHSGARYLMLPTIERLLAEREVLVSHGLVHVDALTDSVNAWVGSDNDPILDRLLTQRLAMVALVVNGDSWAAARMRQLVNAGHLAGPAWLSATTESAHESRLTAVMAATGVSRSGAQAVIAAMDRDIGGLVEAGHSREEAVAAYAIADHLDLDLGLAAERARGSSLGIVDVLDRMAMAATFDVGYESLLALEQFRLHFGTLDNARGGSSDGAVSERDLLHVVQHPGAFMPAQVLAAQAILDEPLLRNRLDTASENTDVLNGRSFGRSEPGDRVISTADIDALAQRAYLNHVLGNYAGEIDTAALGGEVDGRYSERDLNTWLAANPGAPVEVRDAVGFMVSTGLVDESWLERNRDALAMGAAVAAGGVVIVVSGGTWTPVVVAAGFAAGGAAAGLATLSVNHATSDGLGEGLFSNMLGGGMISVSVVGLPTAWTTATAATGGLTDEGAVTMAGFAGEVSGVVSAGGVDLLLPDDWEDEVHDVADAIEVGAGLVGGIRGSCSVEACL